MDAETQAPLMTYTLEVFGPGVPGTQFRVLPVLLRETEENLTDLLPEGYSVRIKEWHDEHD